MPSSFQSNKNTHKTRPTQFNFLRLYHFILFIVILWAQLKTLPLIKVLSYLDYLILTFLCLSFDRCHILVCSFFFLKIKTCKSQILNPLMYTRWSFMPMLKKKSYRKPQPFTYKCYSQERKFGSTLSPCCGENSPKVFELLA